MTTSPYHNIISPFHFPFYSSQVKPASDGHANEAFEESPQADELDVSSVQFFNAKVGFHMIANDRLITGNSAQRLQRMHGNLGRSLHIPVFYSITQSLYRYQVVRFQKVAMVAGKFFQLSLAIAGNI